MSDAAVRPVTVTACVVFAPARGACSVPPDVARAAVEWLARQGFAARGLTAGVVLVSCALDLFGRLCACRLAPAGGSYRPDVRPTLPSPGHLPLRVAGVFLAAPPEAPT